MNIFALTSLIAAVACIFLGNFIYYKNPENRLNQLVASLAFVVGLLAFAEFAYRQAESVGTAIFWLKISSLWTFVPAIYLHISLVFTDKINLLKQKLTYFLIYAPAIIISFLGLEFIRTATLEYWGWTYSLNSISIFLIPMSIWSFVGGLLATLFVLNYYFYTKDKLKKQQTKYIFLGLFAPFIFSFTSDFILPLTTSIRLPEITMSILTIGLIFISYSIWRYRLPILTPAMAANKIISTMSNFLIILNTKKNIVLVNQSALNIIGYKKDDLINKPYNLIINTEDHGGKFFNNIDLNEMGQIKTFETELRSIENNFIPVLMSVSPIKISEEEPFGFVCIGSDLTKEKEIKKALNASERLYSTLVETDPDAIITTDIDGKIVYTSQHALRMYDYENSNELLGKSIFDLISREYQEKTKNDLEKTLKDNILRNLEYRLVKKNGEQFIGEWNIAVIRDSEEKPIAFMTTARDITHHKNIETQLKSSLQEKTVLLREVHHRVKNNLQIISSLLSLQSNYIKDQESFELFKESQNRVKTMAIIHENLYQSGNFAEINVPQYLNNLIKNIYSSYGIDKNLIKAEINAENIYLDINKAIPCFLLINEVLTNCVKHAFSGRKTGEIIINFNKLNHKYIISIKDNGIGLPNDFNIENTKTLGMQLINALTSQLDGKLEAKSNNETEFKITFQ